MPLATYRMLKSWTSHLPISKNSAPTKGTFHLGLAIMITDTEYYAVVFLEQLRTYKPLPAAHLRYLGDLYGVSSTQNAEIRLRFYNLALDITDRDSLLAHAFAEEALKWGTGREELPSGPGVLKGRMKFCRPAFRGAGRVDKEMAKKYFEETKQNFHPIARKILEKVSSANKTEPQADADSRVLHDFQDLESV